MRRSLQRAVVFAFIALSIATPASSATDHVLVWADGNDLNVLNPLLPGAAVNLHLNAMTMAFLTTSSSGPLKAELAERLPTKANHDISPDGKTITVHLRKNLKWSDGEPLTSDDLAFSIALINDPKTNTAGRDGFDLITRVETPDTTTAIIHLSKPFGLFFENVFGDASQPILPKHLLAGHDVNTSDYMQLPVGAGPFRYKRWSRGDSVELEPNPYYFRGQPKLTKIVYRIIPNQQTAATALRTGDIDLFPYTTKDDADALKDVPGIHTTVLPGARNALVMFNVTSPVVRDHAVREALRAGLNRASIVARSYRGGAELDESLVSNDDPGYLHIPTVAFDRTHAAALLDAAGWKPGPDGIRVKNGTRLTINLVAGAGSASVDQILELIRADWAAIGVDVQTRRYQASILFDSDAKVGILMSGKFDAAFFSWGRTRPSLLPSYFTCANIPPHGPGYTRLCDKPLEALFAKYAVTYDPAESVPLARAIQQRMEAVLPIIIVAKRGEYYLMRDNVSGYVPPPFGAFGNMLNVDVTK
jgi:peptide/nickel transport system substrate-binding protein